MAGKGPPKTPTAILKARDSWLAPLRGDEPEPELSDGKSPSGLSPDEAVIWRDVAPKLARVRVLTETDERDLIRYCQIHAQYDRALARVKAEGDKVRVGVLKSFIELSDRVSRLSQQFGMTPASRAAIKVVPKPKEVKGKSRFFGVLPKEGNGE